MQPFKAYISLFKRSTLACQNNIHTQVKENLLILETGQEVLSSRNPFGQEVDTILTDIFSISTLRNATVQKAIDNWHLLRKEEYDTREFQESFTRLKRLLGIKDLEIARGLLEIETLKK